MKKYGIHIGIIIAVIVLAMILMDPFSFLNNQVVTSESTDGSQTNVEFIYGWDPGFMAPPFTLTSIDGEEISLEGLRGKPVLLKFWASWCPKCNATAPNLRRFHDSRMDDIQIVAINLYMADEMSAIEKYVQKHRIEYPIVLDETGEIATEYRVTKTSTYFFINPTGVISERIDYEIVSSEQFEAAYLRALEITAE
jgi:peroxiredoxin